ETRFGGQYGYTSGNELTNNRRGTTVGVEGPGTYFLEGPSGGAADEQIIKDAIGVTVGTINDIFKGVGSQVAIGNFWGGWETSDKDRGGVISGGMLSDGTRFGESGQGDNYKGSLFEKTSTRSPTPEAAIANVMQDLYQSTIQAMQAK